MYLCLETRTSIITTGEPILVDLVELVNSVTISLSQTILLWWLIFLLLFLTVILVFLYLYYLYFLLNLFSSSNASVCFIVAFPPLGNPDHVFISAYIDFSSNSKEMFLFIPQLLVILVLGRISLNLVFLQLLLCSVNRLRLKLYLSFNVNIRSRLIHGFQLLVLLP